MYSNPVAYGQTADSVLPVISVTASGNDGNVPSNAFDNNLATRWSDEGVGSFIQADLGFGPLKTVSSLEIAWYRGSERNNHFVISTSATGATNSFTTVFSGNSARSNSFQSYDVTDTNARYVRVTVNGNTQNDWASINEIQDSRNCWRRYHAPNGSVNLPSRPSHRCFCHLQCCGHIQRTNELPYRHRPLFFHTGANK